MAAVAAPELVDGQGEAEALAAAAGLPDAAGFADGEPQACSDD